MKKTLKDFVTLLGIIITLLTICSLDTDGITRADIYFVFYDVIFIILLYLPFRFEKQYNIMIDFLFGWLNRWRNR